MRFGILGPLVAVDGEGHELALGGPKPRAVLAILLLHPGEVVSTDRLIDGLWGEHPPGSAAKTLQVYISNLRKLLGEGLLLTRAGGYVLETSACELDLAEFEALVVRGRDALEAGQPGAAAPVLDEALKLWRGPPLADFEYEPFAQAEIVRLDEARQTALEDWIDAELGLGRHTTLIGQLEALVREHPLRERLSAQLMLALYRTGRQAEALDAYRRLHAHLSEELGLDPGPAVKMLQMQILEQAPSLDLAAQPAHPPATAARTSLPRLTTPFVGRRPELEAVGSLLGTDETRLVTLTGAGGIGKTRLALAVAHALLDQFSGGVFLVRLAGVTDPAAILPMIAEQVGITGQSELSLLDVLAQRFAAQPALVVLDNFEQLASAGALLADLLSQAGELRLLVTSQVPLRITAERLVALGPLAGEDAVGLFIDRARAALPDFAPDSDELAVIEAICSRLDSMPLAIELAAARVRVLGLGELEVRLERPLELLTRGERDRPERQRSLKAAIEWTHALLDPGQQSLLARLAVCIGPTPLPLVDAVAGPDASPAATLDQLQGLLEFSFARRLEDPRLGVRFLVPQALRDFALERLLAGGQEAQVRRLHAEHVAELAHDARLWKWGATPAQRLRLLAVLQEVRPAVTWARDADPELHVRICSDLASYWVYAGVLSEVVDELWRARESGAGSAADRAWILTLLAKCAQLQSAGNSAQLADQALAEWSSVEDEHERALGLGPLSWVVRWDRHYDEAIEMARQSLEVLRRSGDPRLILRGLVFLAHSLADTRDVEHTEEVLKEADALAAGDPIWELAAIHGDCADYRGDAAAAVRLYAESLSWSSTTGESHQMLMDLRCLARNLANLGEPDAALEVFEIVRLEEERTGRVGDMPTSFEWFGEARLAATELVGQHAAERAAERARQMPVAQRAGYAIELSRRALEASRRSAPQSVQA